MVSDKDYDENRLMEDSRSIIDILSWKDTASIVYSFFIWKQVAPNLTGHIVFIIIIGDNLVSCLLTQCHCYYLIYKV